MKKQLAITLTFIVVASAAQAGTDGFFIGVQTGTLRVHDEPNANISGIHAGYRHYFTNRFSGEVDAAISYASTSESDNIRQLSFGVGYDFPLRQDFVLRPKFAIGTVSDSFRSGSTQGAMNKIGLELAYKNNISFELSRTTYKSGASAGANANMFAINYKF